MDVLPAELIAWGGPLLVTLLTVALIFWLIGKSFADKPNNQIYRQLAYVGLFVFSQVVFVIALPFDDTTQDQLLTLFGYVLTAIIALASTSFVSNAMAGLMLKATGAYRNGDFIHIGEYFGRVTTKALLHTEIQSEDRDTITLPNLYVITNPVKVVDQSGTLISAELSIGFDTHRRKVREHLLTAAEQAGLTDPFVHIVDIGDFAVRYKVTGFLEDLSTIVSKRSELKEQALDVLHQAGIEVMTPNVMNQRPLPADQLMIPRRELSPETDPDSGKAERMMFDKAEIVARIERFKEQSETLTQEIKTLSQDPEANAAEIRWREHQIGALQEIIDKFESADG
jgi:small conductance mechanosensitive channel